MLVDWFKDVSNSRVSPNDATRNSLWPGNSFTLLPNESSCTDCDMLENLIND